MSIELSVRIILHASMLDDLAILVIFVTFGEFLLVESFEIVWILFAILHLFVHGLDRVFVHVDDEVISFSDWNSKIDSISFSGLIFSWSIIVIVVIRRLISAIRATSILVVSTH